MTSFDERFFERIGWRGFLRRHPGHWTLWALFDLFIGVVVGRFASSILDDVTPWGGTARAAAGIVVGVAMVAAIEFAERRGRKARSSA